MSKGKILVVDDSPLVRKLAEATLQEAGYEIYTADDGEEGLKIADTINPDLILVDFIMPKMTGSQFCKLLQESEKLKNIPIILITGKGEEVGKKFAEKFGVLDYFVKPFKSEDLVEKVNSILGKVAEVEEFPAEKFELKEVEELKAAESPFEAKEEEVVEELPVEEKIELPEEIPLEIPVSEEIQIPQPFEEKPEDISHILEETPTVTEEPSLTIDKEEIMPEFLREEVISEEQPLISEEDISIIKEETEEVILPKTEEIEEIISLKGVLEEEIKEPEEVKETPFVEEKEPYKLYEQPTETVNIAEIIEEKMNQFFLEKFPLLLDSSLELLLKKYGVIKDSSIHLSGSLESFNLKDVFELIFSNKLKGILSIYSPKICFEFMFADGEVIYGISNLNKAKLGFKLIYELSDEDIKNITFESVSLLRNINEGSFIFEKKEIKESLLNRKRFIPSDLF